MTVQDLKIGDIFVVETAKGRNNAQTFKVKGNPYYNAYYSQMLVPVHVMRKGTESTKPIDLKVIKVDNWISPFPKNN